MSNNHQKIPGKQNSNNPKRPFDNNQRERINPNQRPQDRGYNHEAAGRDEWQRRERPNQGNQGNQGRQHPGQGQGGHKGGNLGNNHGREQRQ